MNTLSDCGSSPTVSPHLPPGQWFVFIYGQARQVWQDIGQAPHVFDSDSSVDSSPPALSSRDSSVGGPVWGRPRWVLRVVRHESSGTDPDSFPGDLFLAVAGCCVVGRLVNSWRHVGCVFSSVTLLSVIYWGSVLWSVYCDPSSVSTTIAAPVKQFCQHS